MAGVVVRRVRTQEWREVRELRLRAVSDPDAGIAFLSTPAQELARDDTFWQERTAGAALGDTAAQFVAVDGDGWVGTATVLLREAGDRDYFDRAIAASRADVVGVYLAPSHRGTGILDRLFDAARAWCAERGIDALTLDVHTDNARAQAAYRKAGFVATGVTYTSTAGLEIEMRAAHR